MQKFKTLLGSGFNAGFLPNAPGTWGSFFALIPIYFIGTYLAPWGMPAFVLLCSLLNLWVADACEQAWGSDPSPLVMDEFAGQSMTFIWIPFFPTAGANIGLLIAGFFLFRFFDIKKPLGVDALQKLPGGFGILVDDLLAGVYAFLILRLLLFLLA